MEKRKKEIWEKKRERKRVGKKRKEEMDNGRY